MTLGQLRDGAGVPALIEMTQRDDNEHWLRERAIFWLGNADDDRARATLRALASSDTLARDLRDQAIFALGFLDSDGDNGPFLRSLYAPARRQQLKDKVIQAVAQLDDAADQRWLVDRVLDTNESVELRKQALFWRGQKNVGAVRRPDRAVPAARLARAARPLRVRALAAPASRRPWTSSSISPERHRSRDPREGDVLARPESRSAGLEVSRGEDLQMMQRFLHDAGARGVERVDARRAVDRRSRVARAATDGSNELRHASGVLRTRREHQPRQQLAQQLGRQRSKPRRRVGQRVRLRSRTSRAREARRRDRGAALRRSADVGARPVRA